MSWSPPTPLGDTTGYRIYYSSGSSGSADVSDGSTDNYLLTGLQNGESYDIFIVGNGSTDNYLLTGLQNGESYDIFIVGTSEHLPSERIGPVEVTLGEGNTHTHHPIVS